MMGRIVSRNSLKAKKFGRGWWGEGCMFPEQQTPVVQCVIFPPEVWWPLGPKPSSVNICTMHESLIEQ